MVQAFDGILGTCSANVEVEDIHLPFGNTIPNSLDTDFMAEWVVRWDGSFDGKKAGLGITLAL
jgi:hypothetical protein